MLIIGAGIIGASIAYHLAKRGVSPIVLVDKDKAGSGSTASSLGGFRHQFSSELSVRLSIESIRALEKFKEETGWDPQIRRDGYLFVASTERGLEELEAMSRIQRSLGVAVSTVSQAELSRMLPFYDFGGVKGGNHCREDGHAQTSAVLQGYLSKAKELGVRLLEDLEVTGIVKKDGKVSGVLTEAGAIDSEKVIIAAGVHSKRLGALAGERVPVDPYPRKILFTRGVPPGVPESIPLIIDIDTTLALGREGRSMFFSDNIPTEPGFELRFPHDYDERVISKAIARVPALSSLPVGYSVTGLYEVTPDSNPIISELRTGGLYCCAGFAGHGFMHAPAAGELMTEIVLEEAPHLDVSSFRADRFGEDTPKERLVI